MAVSQRDPLLILGGGLIGMAVAHELARKGKHIKVLSRCKSQAAGFVAAGMLAPHAEGLKSKLLKLGQLSLKKIPRWVKQIEQDSGLNCGLKDSGTVVPFLNIHELQKYPTVSFGSSLNRQELEVEIPGIHSKWNKGLLFKQDGQIDSRRKLMQALHKACLELGVVFQEGVEVLELIEKEKYFEGVRIRDKEGEVRNISGKQGLLCSGAWSNQLIKTLPVFPVKGQMLSLQGPRNALKRIIFGPGFYMVPREDGLIIVGATSEKDAGFNTVITPKGWHTLYKGVDQLFPSATQWPPIETWVGFRPGTPDEMPLLGKSDIEGLWIATGHYRNGILLAAITAELLAKSICDQNMSTQEKDLLNVFKWNRFKKINRS